MTKAERDQQRRRARECTNGCEDCYAHILAMHIHADEMDALLRDLDGMLARGELATAVQTKIRGVLETIDK